MQHHEKLIDVILCTSRLWCSKLADPVSQQDDVRQGERTGQGLRILRVL